MKRRFLLTPEAKGDLKEVTALVYVWEAKPIQVVCIVHGARDLASFFHLRISREN